MNRTQIEKVLCQFEATTEAIKGIESKTIRVEQHLNEAQCRRENLMKHFEDATLMIDNMTDSMDQKTDEILDFFTHTLDTFASLVDSFEKTIFGLGLADALPELQQELWPLMVPTVVLVIIVTVSNCIFGFYLADDPDLAGTLTIEAVMNPKTAEDMKDGTSILNLFAIFHLVLIGIAFLYVSWEMGRRVIVPRFRRRRQKQQRRYRRQEGSQRDSHNDGNVVSQGLSDQGCDCGVESDEDCAASEVSHSEVHNGNPLVLETRETASAGNRAGQEGNCSSLNSDLARKRVMFTDDPGELAPQQASPANSPRGKKAASGRDAASPLGGSDSNTSSGKANSQKSRGSPNKHSPQDTSGSIHGNDSRTSVYSSSRASVESNITDGSPPVTAPSFKGITPGGISTMLRNLQEAAKKEQEKHKAEMEHGVKRKGRFRGVGSTSLDVLSPSSQGDLGSPRSLIPPKSVRSEPNRLSSS